MKYRPLTVSRFVTQVGAAAVVLLIFLAVSPGIGREPIGVFEAWGQWSVDSITHDIAFQLRLPRAVKAMVAGLTLSLCGAVFQSMFRNVLATPYTLGIASGGSLGALIGVKLGLIGTFLGLSGVSWCALAGCGTITMLVLAISGGVFRLTGNTLVLVGVTLGFFCSAMMMFVTYLADVHETYVVVRWMMGSLDSIGHGQIGHLLPVLCVSWAVLLAAARALNQFELGDEIAASRGVRPVRFQMLSIGFASIATGCIVSICGPIGFVGLIVPQAARQIVGRDHRILLPISALWGGVFLILCDWLTTLVPTWYGALAGAEMTASRLPIGVMTSVIGAPIFLFLLWRSGKPSG